MKNYKPTKIEKLLAVLSDKKWHSTKELVRKVGHTFSTAKYRLITYGYHIKSRLHPARKHQWEYRLLDDEEEEQSE